MSLRSILLGITVLIVMTGCKSTFQSNWTNFNAYYNTYYNAKQSYKTGLQKNLNQPRDYNPLQPIRIHPKPVNAGTQDFEKAIEKGADVLRRYEESKWVDNAIGLIGRSYYYQQEYFSADQKFKELFVTTTDEKLQQESIIWQGRVLLEMELYNEGVAFLSEQLALQDEIWSDARKAEAKALLAQHHVELENWQTAATELSEALPDLRNKEFRERGYFLLGQIYERIGNPEAAFEAYDQVKNHYVEYRVQYLAQRKKAEVARELGRNEVAYRIFNDMVRDDKNLDYKAELDFELARTQHERGELEQAERSYNKVLRNRFSQPPAEIAAQTYNGLAEIYRYEYNDFNKAAAYYDSAAQRNVSAEKLPEDFRAQELAESFGKYSDIRSEIALQDSLLRLGKLDQQEFDSVITALKKKKLEELERLREEQQNQQNQMVTGVEDEDTQEATNMTNGFLNSNNPVLQQNARQQFLAMWGGRPLADNWRVEDLIDYGSLEDDEAAEDQQNEEQAEVAQIQIDISRVPFTPQAQDSVRKLIAASQYEMGNLFFLSLSMPDSAIHYFNKAIENPSSENVNMVSLYSLSELYDSQGNQDQAIKYAQRLIDEYPYTEYSSRVSETFGLEAPEHEIPEMNVIEVYQGLTNNDSLSTAERASKLRLLALEHSDQRIAPQALYEAIQAYTEAGKSEEHYQSNVDDWMNGREQWDLVQSRFQERQDSLREVLSDTTLTLPEEERDQYQAVVDSSLQQPDFSEYFPYEGANWDSARAAIDTFLVEFQDSNLRSRVTRLQQEISKPSEEEEDQEPDQTQPQDETSPAVSEGEYLSCGELETSLSIRGGLDTFLSNLDLPDDPDSEQITYTFQVNQRGIVENYELYSDSTSENIMRTFEEAFQRNLAFEPILSGGQAVSVECEFTFPLRD